MSLNRCTIKKGFRKPYSQVPCESGLVSHHPLVFCQKAMIPRVMLIPLYSIERERYLLSFPTKTLGKHVFNLNSFGFMVIQACSTTGAVQAFYLLHFFCCNKLHYIFPSALKIDTLFICTWLKVIYSICAHIFFFYCLNILQPGSAEELQCLKCTLEEQQSFKCTDSCEITAYTLGFLHVDLSDL